MSQIDPNAPETIFALYNAAMVLGFYDEADVQANRLRGLGYVIPERIQPAPVGLLAGRTFKKPRRVGARVRKKLANA